MSGVIASEFVGHHPPGFLPLAFDEMAEKAFGKQLFDFAEAEAEAMVQPHGVADNLREETVTVVTGCGGFHGAQSAKSELT